MTTKETFFGEIDRWLQCNSLRLTVVFDEGSRTVTLSVQGGAEAIEVAPIEDLRKATLHSSEIQKFVERNLPGWAVKW